MVKRVKVAAAAAVVTTYTAIFTLPPVAGLIAVNRIISDYREFNLFTW